MSICDEIANWDETDANDRYRNARDTIKDLARDMGFGDDVKVRREAPPAPYQGVRAAYDRNTDTIYLHPDLFKSGREGGWKYLYDSAAEELGHHMQDEMDEELADAQDDEENAEEGDVPVSEEESERSMENHDDEREDDAKEFAQEFMALAEEMCENDPDGAESALRGLLEEFLEERWEQNVREDLEDEEDGEEDDDSPRRPGDWRLPAEPETADA